MSHTHLTPLTPLLVLALWACTAAPVEPDAGPPSDARPADAAPAVDSGSPDASESPSCGAEFAGEPGVVVTSAGAVRGVAGEGVTAFLGLPFADRPTRWEPPAARACWDGVREADAFPPMCPQIVFDPSEPDAEGVIQGEEDCLALNVWAPSVEAEPRPVLVYIHGGGNQQGSSSQQAGGTALFAGDLLAARGDVLVVTLQYRLGPFGYLVHPAVEDGEGRAGNYGLLDQLAALRWVQDNIAAFGGDPERVMLFGESGGAVDVCALVASPLGAGLFSSALMQSGACVADARETALEVGLEGAAAVGCPAGSDRACLEEASIEDWLSAVDSPIGQGLVSSKWGASVDGYVLLDVPQASIRRGEHNHVPIVVGSNADETASWVPMGTTPEFVRIVFGEFEPYTDELLELYPPGTTNEEARAAYVAASTDGQFTCTARRLARDASAAQEPPVFRYFFEHRTVIAPGRELDAAHGLELPYVFGTIERTGLGPRLSDDDRAVIAFFAERWSALAREGAPRGALEWPAYDEEERSVVIAGEPRVEAEIRRARCEVWDAIQEAAQ